MISDELIEILRCPEDHTPVHRADGDLLESLNEQIRAGELQTREGELVLDLLEEGLSRFARNSSPGPRTPGIP